MRRQGLAKTVIAFANSKGGLLLIGVEPPGSLLGAPGDNVHAMLMDVVRGRTRPSIDVDVLKLSLGSKTVYAIQVPRSARRHHVLASNGVPYVRKGLSDCWPLHPTYA